MRTALNLIFASTIFLVSNAIAQTEIQTIVEELKVNDEKEGLYSNYHSLPVYSKNNNGDFIIVWESYQSGKHYFVCQLFNKMGSAIGKNKIFPITAEYIYNFKVLLNDNRSFTIFRIEYWNGKFQLFGQSFNDDFTEISSNTRIIQYPSTDFTVTKNVDGFYTIGWSNFESSEMQNNKMCFQIFDIQLKPINNINYFSKSINNKAPVIAWGKNNDFLISWIIDGKGYVKYFTNGGKNFTSDILISNFVYAFSFKDVINDNNGNFLLTWNQQYSVGTILFDTHILSAKNLRMFQTENNSIINSKIIFENNNFYIFWNYSNSINKIYGQRLNNEGEIEGEIFTNNLEQYDFNFPSLSELIYIDISNIFIVYAKLLNYSNLYLQKISALDSKIYLPSAINDDLSTADKKGTAIIANKNKNFKVVWSDNRYQKTKYTIFENYDIFLQRFDSLGKFILNNEIVNDDIKNTNLIYPSMAEVSDGSFMICWNDFRDSKDIGFPKGKIYAQYFSPDGIKQRNNFSVDESAICVNYPQVFSNNDKFYFFWVDKTIYNGYLDKNTLKLKIYSNKGVQLSEIIKLNDNRNLIIGEKPKLEFNQKGEILICWNDFSENNNDIYYQYLTENGLKIGGNLKFKNLTIKNELSSLIEKKEVFKIVYKNTFNEIYYQLINPYIGICSTPQLVQKGILNCYPRDPQLFFNKDGSFFITWVGDILNNLTEMTIDYSLLFLKNFYKNGEENGDNIILNSSQKVRIESINTFYKNDRFFLSYINKQKYFNEEYYRGDVIRNLMVKVFKIYNPLSDININTIVNQDFLLSQNYPNPFNPSTSIKFSIPETANVKLIVYDVLGKAITTLVNENKSPGIYEVDFNGSELSSGIYFYKIEMGKYVSVKKMMLIK